MSDIDELQDLLEVGESSRSSNKGRNSTRPHSDDDDDSSAATVDSVQWEVGGNGSYRPTGATEQFLPAGVYSISVDNHGLFFSRINLVTDSLVDLKETASKRIIDSIRDFWKKEVKYREHGIVYKRGVLAWGPAGSGKTAAVTTCIKDLIEQQGLVLLVRVPQHATMALKAIRRIEKGRRLIVVLEDIEEIISSQGEHDLLALLDGEHQVENVVYIATTNYPEQLGKRIVNRPSRFDEVLKVGMPGALARKLYLEHVLKGSLDKATFDKWVADTQDFSVAHLKELFVAVACLGRNYEETLKRLKGMSIQVRSSDRNSTGFRDTNVEQTEA